MCNITPAMPLNLIKLFKPTKLLRGVFEKWLQMCLFMEGKT